MHFLSLTWLAWMAGTVSVYWLAPREWRHWVLVAVSLAFLAIHAPVSAILLVGFTLLTYFATRREHVSGWQAAGVSAVMIAVLVFYKVAVSGVAGTIIENAVIPLGLSYYTFRCLHLTIERYKTAAPPTRFGDVVEYLVFLPTFVVGPIHRYQPFQRDLRRHRWDFDMLTEGLERILYGYVKIAVLGNYIVSTKLVGLIESLPPESEALSLYLLVVSRGLSVYFQFAGFSDIAIGFALLLGFRVMENFNWPYFQPNISAFWNCWHISLSSWCRNYIYDVVIATLRSPALGALATLTVIALWHEISPRYFVWGLYHGLGIVLWQQFQKVKPRLPQSDSPILKRTARGLSILLTVHFVWYSFVIVSQPTFRDVWHIYRSTLFAWL